MPMLLRKVTVGDPERFPHHAGDPFGDVCVGDWLESRGKIIDWRLVVKGRKSR